MLFLSVCIYFPSTARSACGCASTFVVRFPQWNIVIHPRRRHLKRWWFRIPRIRSRGAHHLHPYSNLFWERHAAAAFIMVKMHTIPATNISTPPHSKPNLQSPVSMFRCSTVCRREICSCRVMHEKKHEEPTEDVLMRCRISYILRFYLIVVWCNARAFVALRFPPFYDAHECISKSVVKTIKSALYRDALWRIKTTFPAQHAVCTWKMFWGHALAINSGESNGKR